MNYRLRVMKGNIMIANLPVLYAIAAAIISPHLAVISAVLALLLGYTVKVER